MICVLDSEDGDCEFSSEEEEVGAEKESADLRGDCILDSEDEDCESDVLSSEEEEVGADKEMGE